MIDRTIELLMKAEAWSRELDFMFQQAIGKLSTRATFRQCRYDWDYGFSWEDPDEGGYTEICSYTTNLQHAVEAIPEGWGISSLWEAAKPADRPWWGVDLRRDEPYKLVRNLGGKTAPLIICIAILKALKASEN